MFHYGDAKILLHKHIVLSEKDIPGTQMFKTCLGEQVWGSGERDQETSGVGGVTC